MKFNITVAGEEHINYVQDVEKTILEASKVKGTGLAKRSKQYLSAKIMEGKAVIALTVEGEFAGFCYVESWGHEKFVANSGLIVLERFRGHGLAMKIKEEAFKLSRKVFPAAKMFGLTTSLAVMKINSELGYKPVTFSELTDDDEFWKGCQSCAYYDILFRTNRTHCLCTAMLYDPEKEENGWGKRKKSSSRKKNTVRKNGRKSLSRLKIKNSK
ncbi:GNAT family N-acetyltransferase [Bacteroidota bacterium]